MSRENGPARVKRMPTRSTVGDSRSALGDIGNTRLAPRPAANNKVAVRKESVKFGGRRRMVKQPVEEQPMEVDDDVVECQPEPDTLPPGVADIDTVDAANPQLCVDYVPHMYAYLRQLEEKTPVRQDFLKGCPINGKMRGVLLDWLVEVHLQFKLLQETLYMTIAIIDRFLQAEGLTLRRNKLQLVGVTAMFIASKVEEMYAPEINDFVYITDNAYTAGEIRIMEMRILNCIEFGVGRPLPLHFLRRNSKAGDVDVLQHTVAKYFLEASITEYEMAHYSPSMMAAASLYLSLLLLEPNAQLTTCWTPTLAHYSAYTKAQILPVVFKIAAVIKKAKDSKLQVVYTKYCSKKFLKVAEMAELRGEVIEKLANKNTEGL